MHIVSCKNFLPAFLPVDHPSILYRLPTFVSVAAATAPALTVVIKLDHLPFGWNTKATGEKVPGSIPSYYRSKFAVTL